MKSRILMLVVALMLVLSTVASADVLNQPEQDDELGSLTISGQIDGYGYADAFTLAVFNAGKTYGDITELTPENMMSAMTHFGTYMTDAEGSYEIQYSTKNLSAGDYTVRLITKDGTVYEKPIFIASRDSKIKFVGEVAELVENDCTAEELKTKLGLTDAESVNAKVFEILEDNIIFTVDADGLSAVVLYNIKEAENFEDTTPEDFVAFLEACAQIQSVNEGLINVTDYAELFELDKDYLATYNKYVTDEEKKAFATYLKGNDFMTNADVSGFFNNCVILSVIGNADAWADYKAVIEAHGEDIDIDMDDYEDLSSTKKNKISGYLENSYDDIEDFADDVNDAIDEIKKPKSSGSGSGGSGGFGGSSGRGTSGITGVKTEDYPVDMTPEPEKEHEKKPIEFTDLDSSAWAKEAIDALSAEGIVSGIGEGLFAPEASVTREQFVKMIVSALGITAEESENQFTDLENGAWYTAYVNAAAKSGIVNGIGDGKFGVGANITRQDAAVMLLNAAKLSVEDGEITFTDAEEISEYAKGAVKQLNKLGVINGVGDGSFAPKATCTRAQAAVMIHRLIGIISK